MASIKRCPVCNRTYSDEKISFCLADGALLSASEDPQATLVLPEPEAKQVARTEVLPADNTIPQKKMLELRNITKRFGDVLANDHINIQIAEGTIHAIVGENGAGKSTAMRI